MAVVYFNQQAHACACVGMVKNDRKHWKMMKKSTFSIMRTRGSCKAHEEKQRKKFVGQRLRVTPKSWLLIWNFFFYMSNACAWRKMFSERSKNNKISNEQPAFRCQPAFGSHSQLLTNKLFSSFIFMHLTWASRTHDGKGTFSSFSNVFDRFRACVRWSKYTTIIFPFLQVSSAFDSLDGCLTNWEKLPR